MELSKSPKKMNWRHSIVCWRGPRQLKETIELHPNPNTHPRTPSPAKRNTAVDAFETREYGKKPHHGHNNEYIQNPSYHQGKPRPIARPISVKGSTYAATGNPIGNESKRTVSASTAHTKGSESKWSTLSSATHIKGDPTQWTSSCSTRLSKGGDYKWTSSSSTRYTAETTTTATNSAESAPRPHATSSREVMDYRIPVQHAHHGQRSTSTKVRQPKGAPMVRKHAASTTNTHYRRIPQSKPPRDTMYVAIKHDNETITALSESDVDDDDDVSSQSNSFNTKSLFGKTYGRPSGSEDMSDINGYTTYQPDGFLEATILRTDSDSTKDISVLGDEAHVGVYNLSERMRYDLREAGRTISTIASQVARACMTQPKLITK